MTAVTATQGFIYATGSDSPAATSGTVAALVSQLDTKANGFDADSARAVANNFVKVSKSNFTASTTSTVITFDTVEANRGTTTDLTTDAQHLSLGTGYWLIGAEILWMSVSGNGNTPIELSLFTPSGGNGATPIAVTYKQETRDSGGAFNTGTGLLNFDGRYQGLSVSTMLQVSTANQWVGCSWGVLLVAANVLYISLWAFQVGDL